MKLPLFTAVAARALHFICLMFHFSTHLLLIAHLHLASTLFSSSYSTHFTLSICNLFMYRVIYWLRLVQQQHSPKCNSTHAALYSDDCSSSRSNFYENQILRKTHPIWRAWCLKDAKTKYKIRHETKPVMHVIKMRINTETEKERGRALSNE